jgi:hypothetical protein
MYGVVDCVRLLETSSRRVVLQVVYHVRVLTVVFLLNDLSFCMILKGLYNVYVLTLHLKLLQGQITSERASR